MRPAIVAALAVIIIAPSACGAPDGAAVAEWTGTVDTTSSGHVHVRNTAQPIWTDSSAWRVEEDLRIGRVEGEGADVFGRIVALEVDDSGRLWLFDSQSQELKVFSPSGSHVRTIGRQGGGPGEFAQAVRVDQAPDGNIWVMDPQNNRISVFDTAGAYLRAETAPGGFIMLPWPGRFTADGSYYAPVPQIDTGFRIAFVRYDTSFTPVDTLEFPEDPVEREHFELRSGGLARMMAGVPFQGGLTWRLTDEGTIWAMMTDQYRLFEMGPNGDTLRTITREFTPLPVTAADREQAREDLEWFTDQGGQIDLSKLPATKPATRSFIVDDEANLWVEQVTSSEQTGRVHDVFDPAGRFMGTVTLPFALSVSPFPIIEDGMIYGVTQDELGVQYVVRGLIVRP